MWAGVVVHIIDQNVTNVFLYSNGSFYTYMVQKKNDKKWEEVEKALKCLSNIQFGIFLYNF